MPKRKSVTDGMGSDAEKLMSGVQRELIRILDADTQPDELREHWPDHPPACEVVVPGPRGHAKYIGNIADRLEALGFAFGKFPHRSKRPGQPSAELEALIRRRQAKEKVALTADQRVRIEQNRLRALEIRAQREESAFWEGIELAQAEEQPTPPGVVSPHAARHGTPHGTTHRGAA